MRFVSLRTAALALIALGLAALLVRALHGGTPPARTGVEWTVVTPTRASAPAAVPPAGEGTLVLIQGLTERRLVLAPLDGTPAAFAVDDHVATWPLLPDPSGGRVFYSAERAVLVLDLAARRADIVGELPEGGQVLLAQWSPDGGALAYVAVTEEARIAYATRADGSQAAVELDRVPRGLPLDVGWLADGRPVVIRLGLGARGGLEALVEAYDPATGAHEPVAPGAEVIQPWAPWRAPDGAQVYAAKTWDDANQSGACRTGSLGLARDEWLYLYAGVGAPPQVAFEAKGLFMDRPTWLADGRVLFRAIADEGCTSLPTGLYLGRVGETPAPLVTSTVGYSTDSADRMQWSLAYALHGTDLAWSENDLGAQVSTVRAMPLDGGDARLLLHTAPPDDPAQPFAYRDREAILTFVWLP